MSDDEIIFADAFGGKFPVCSQEDKVAIEEAFKKATEWMESTEGKVYDQSPRDCMCGIIARLLKGEASHGDMVSLGLDMARDTYLRKTAAVALMGLMRNAAMPDDGPLMVDNPKKKWIN